MNLWTRWVDIQKAVPFEEKRLFSKHWKPPWIIQPKLDGDRMRAVFDDLGKVTLLSSEAKEIWAAPHIKDQLESSGLKNIELDGEVYIHGTPQAVIHGMISSQRVELHEDFDKLEYHIFDIVDEYRDQGSRLIQLAKNFPSWFSEKKNLAYVPYSITYEVDDVYKYLYNYRKKGFEGFILRNPTAPYLRSRSAYVMMKFKPGREDTYTIVGVNEAISMDGKPKGMVGSFNCTSPPDPKVFRSGAGELTHEERIAYWIMRNQLIGKQIRVAYQHLTAKNSVPRHGVTLEIL